MPRVAGVSWLWLVLGGAALFLIWQTRKEAATNGQPFIDALKERLDRFHLPELGGRTEDKTVNLAVLPITNIQRRG